MFQWTGWFGVSFRGLVVWGVSLDCVILRLFFSGLAGLVFLWTGRFEVFPWIVWSGVFQWTGLIGVFQWTGWFWVFR